MNRLHISTAAAVVLLCVPAAGRALQAQASARDRLPAAMAAIREADLRRDLFAMSGDSMRGREAGTLDEMRAAVWVADAARAAGLQPAGDNGTYFQFFPMHRVRLADASRATLGSRQLALWRDAHVFAPTDAAVDLPVVFVGEGREADVASLDLHGKAVAAVLSPARDTPPAWISLYGLRYARAAIRERAAFLTQRGAAAVILVSDTASERAWGIFGAALRRGTYGLDTAGVDQRPKPTVPVIWLPRSALDEVRAPGQRLVATFSTESYSYPSVNVVARVPGTDPRLRGENVLFSGHHDHDGVRFPVNGDSIYNGADDNASVSVALLAIGRAFARQPGRRSALFVWHGAEERGLLGSRWYADHPTVPKASIVAVLNGDMIGRNSPDSAALLGTTPPHRNSAQLVEMAMRANRLTGGFAIDTSWDSPTHPEGWYFRSDHLPYARAGIPSLFFTTLLHPDYHTPRDEPQRIDIAKLAHVTRWMYATGWLAANAADRPAVDAGFKLER